MHSFLIDVPNFQQYAAPSLQYTPKAWSCYVFTEVQQSVKTALWVHYLSDL
jgi:hypothetical protein